MEGQGVGTRDTYLHDSGTVKSRSWLVVAAEDGWRIPGLSV